MPSRKQYLKIFGGDASDDEFALLGAMDINSNRKEQRSRDKMARKEARNLPVTSTTTQFPKRSANQPIYDMLGRMGSIKKGKKGSGWLIAVIALVVLCCILSFVGVMLSVFLPGRSDSKDDDDFFK